MIVKYCIVGVLNTALAASIMSVLGWLGAHYLVYSNIAYFVAIINSYLLNAYWTFRASSLSVNDLVLFTSVNLGVMSATSVIQYAIIDLAGVPELIGVICGMFFYTITGFTLNRSLVFNHRLRSALWAWLLARIDQMR